MMRWKPSSNSTFSIRAFRAYPPVEIRQTVSCRAIRAERISVNSPHSQQIYFLEVPAQGYFTSSFFTKYPDDAFGSKSFMIIKPDHTETKVTVKVAMRHVLPIMRFTQGFKVNVPEEALELKAKSMFRIMIGKAKAGEEFNYPVDRFITLLSIILLSSDKSQGLFICSGFLTLKALSFLNIWFSAMTAAKESHHLEEEEGNPEEHLIKVN